MYQNPTDLESFDEKIQTTYNELGAIGLARVLFDTALSRNKRQLNTTSNPVLDMRKEFDIYHDSRSSVMWGADG